MAVSIVGMRPKGAGSISARNGRWRAMSPKSDVEKQKFLGHFDTEREAARCLNAWHVVKALAMIGAQ